MDRPGKSRYPFRNKKADIVKEVGKRSSSNVPTKADEEAQRVARDYRHTRRSRNFNIRSDNDDKRHENTDKMDKAAIVMKDGIKETTGADKPLEISTDTNSTDYTDVSLESPIFSIDSEEIATDSSGISTDLAEISRNSTDISTDSSGISTDSSGISTDLAEISTNSTDISTDSSGISTDSSGITSNSVAISLDSSGFFTELNKISTHSTEISTDSAKISVDLAKIATDSSRSSIDSTEISSQSADSANICTDSANISISSPRISTDLAKITTHLAGISTYSSGSFTDLDEISTDSAKISTDSAKITDLSRIFTDLDEISTDSSGIFTDSFEISSDSSGIFTESAVFSTDSTEICTDLDKVSTDLANISIDSMDSGFGSESASSPGVVSSEAGPSRSSRSAVSRPRLSGKRKVVRTPTRSTPFRSCKATIKSKTSSLDSKQLIQPAEIVKTIVGKSPSKPSSQDQPVENEGSVTPNVDNSSATKDKNESVAPNDHYTAAKGKTKVSVTPNDDSTATKDKDKVSVAPNDNPTATKDKKEVSVKPNENYTATKDKNKVSVTPNDNCTATKDNSDQSVPGESIIDTEVSSNVTDVEKDRSQSENNAKDTDNDTEVVPIANSDIHDNTDIEADNSGEHFDHLNPGIFDKAHAEVIDRIFHRLERLEDCGKLNGFEDYGKANGFKGCGKLDGFENCGKLDGFEHCRKLGGFEDCGKLDGFEHCGKLNGFGDRGKLYGFEDCEKINESENMISIPSTLSLVGSETQSLHDSLPQPLSPKTQPQFAASGDSSDSDSESEVLEPVDWEIGDLVWAKVTSHPWWPSMIAEDPFKSYTRITRRKKREYHVQFFGEYIERAWIVKEKLLEYKGQEHFNQHVKEVLEKAKGSKQERRRLERWFGLPAQRKEAVEKGIIEADAALPMSREERFEEYGVIYKPPEPKPEPKKRKQHETDLITPQKQKIIKAELINPRSIATTPGRYSLEDKGSFHVYYVTEHDKVLYEHPELTEDTLMDFCKQRWNVLGINQKARYKDCFEKKFNEVVSRRRVIGGSRPTMRLTRSSKSVLDKGEGIMTSSVSSQQSQQQLTDSDSYSTCASEPTSDSDISEEYDLAAELQASADEDTEEEEIEDLLSQISSNDNNENGRSQPLLRPSVLNSIVNPIFKPIKRLIFGSGRP